MLHQTWICFKGGQRNQLFIGPQSTGGDGGEEKGQVLAHFPSGRSPSDRNGIISYLLVIPMTFSAIVSVSEWKIVAVQFVRLSH